MAKKVLGFRKFTSKGGNECRMLTVMEPYTDHAKQAGAVGNRVEDLFIPRECNFVVTEKDVGREVIVDYDVVGNRAYVSSVTWK